eukprot:gene7791-1396_t
MRLALAVLVVALPRAVPVHRAPVGGPAEDPIVAMLLDQLSDMRTLECQTATALADELLQLGGTDAALAVVPGLVATWPQDTGVLTFAARTFRAAGSRGSICLVNLIASSDQALAAAVHCAAIGLAEAQPMQHGSKGPCSGLPPLGRASVPVDRHELQSCLASVIGFLVSLTPIQAGLGGVLPPAPVPQLPCLPELLWGLQAAGLPIHHFHLASLLHTRLGSPPKPTLEVLTPHVHLVQLAPMVRLVTRPGRLKPSAYMWAFAQQQDAYATSLSTAFLTGGGRLCPGTGGVAAMPEDRQGPSDEAVAAWLSSNAPDGITTVPRQLVVGLLHTCAACLNVFAEHIRLGADASAISRFGWSALHYAALQDDAALSARLALASPELLFARTADSGHTPLHVAASRGSRAVVYVLVLASLKADWQLPECTQARKGTTGFARQAALDLVVEALGIISPECPSLPEPGTAFPPADLPDLAALCSASLGWPSRCNAAQRTLELVGTVDHWGRTASDVSTTTGPPYGLTACHHQLLGSPAPPAQSQHLEPTNASLSQQLAFSCFHDVPGPFHGPGPCLHVGLALCPALDPPHHSHLQPQQALCAKGAPPGPGPCSPGLQEGPAEDHADSPASGVIGVWDPSPADQEHMVDLFVERYLSIGLPVLIAGNVGGEGSWLPKAFVKASRQSFNRKQLLAHARDHPVTTGRFPYAANFGRPEATGPLSNYIGYLAQVRTNTSRLTAPPPPVVPAGDASQVDIQTPPGDIRAVLLELHQPQYHFAHVHENSHPMLPQALHSSLPSLLNPRGALNATSAHWQISIGPPLSGAPVHFHNQAINHLVYGRKLWFLFPPRHAQWSIVPIHEWLLANPAALSNAVICLQEAGDTVFVPSGWGHGVLNLQDSLGFAIEFTWGNSSP